MSDRFVISPSTARNGTMKIRAESGSSLVMVIDGVTEAELRQLAAACIRAAETLASNIRCETCGARRDNHPYRHPFKAIQFKDGQR